MPGEAEPEARIGSRVDLPEPRSDGTVSVERSLRERRSLRDYARAPLTLAEVAQLLWSAQGITGRGGLRTAPSAGALYPLESYAVGGEVEGLAPGVYRYEPRHHRLTCAVVGDLRRALAAAALNQDYVHRAPATLVFTAIYERTTGTYGARGERYVHMDLGHAAENVYLQCVSLGLGTVALGAFDDRGVKRLLCLRPEEKPLYLMPVGRRRP
jgi:SagB-type dehydrogenase family enzyme